MTDGKPGVPVDLAHVAIAPAAFNDHESIAALLTASGLPVPGPDEVPVHMLAAYATEPPSAIIGAPQVTTLSGLIGCVGWESHGTKALLRSLAVEQACRGRGVGIALVDTLIDILMSFDVDEVFLLTTDAGPFFARFGFEAVDRLAVPAPVLESKEFGMGCCATAQCMKLRIEQEAEGK